MIKTHQNTGLKYLCKTSRKSPHKYPGSGLYWRRHLDKHGYYFTTEIIKECQSNEELRYWGVYYSNLWNVTESNEWANLKSESGDGGSDPGIYNGMYGKHHSAESKEKIKNSNLGKIRTAETRQKMSKNHVGNTGKPLSDDAKQKISKAHKNRPKTEEHKQKIANANKGKVKSLEHRQKISLALKNRASNLSKNTK